MAISINPSVPVVAAQVAGSATDGVVLQPGTTVAAQVQSVLAGNLVRIAIANLSLDVLTEVALTPGQNLQLAVSQTQTGVVRLQIVGQGVTAGDAASLAPNMPVVASTDAAAPSDPLNPLERIAVSVASENAVTQQQSLALLFANLVATAASDNLPPALQKAIAEVLAQQTSLDEKLSGSDIQKALQKSGLFLEASLASGAVPGTGSTPDLKAALIVLRQTLAALEPAENPVALTPAAAGASASAAKRVIDSPSLAPPQPNEADGHQLPPQLRLPFPDLPAGDPAKLLAAQALLSAGPRSVSAGEAINLLQEAVQAIPRAAANPADVIASPDGRSRQETVSTTTPPPPFRGALPSAQPVANPSIEPNAPLSPTVHHLIDDTDAALARQTLLQVASLPDRADANGNRSDASVPRWNFEIPFVTPQGTAMAQFEISRDGGGGLEIETAQRTWQARFSINVEPAGPVHALISLSGDRASVRMWAERPQTAAQLRAGASELSQALSQAELSPGDIVIREGTPPHPAPAKAGHFLDRAL
ncbi:MAG TPA: flagellar hook-length control protein FliK [Burkholderiales bacterium]|nr:flagellar hook-length control protein FliK [Burkholderiales bacterium]